MLDRVERELAQVLAKVAVGIEIPVVTVEDEPLRRHGSIGRLPGAARPVAHAKAAPLQRRSCHCLEHARGQRPCGLAEHANALADLGGFDASFLEEHLEPRTQRRDVRRQQARLQVVQHRVHRQQRVDFRRVEPQTGQRVLRPLARGDEFVAAAIGVPDDRRVEALAHVLEVALERGGRYLQRVEECLARDQLALVQQPVDQVEPLASIHEVRAGQCAPGRTRTG